MDFLEEAKSAAAKLKSLNEKIAGLTPNDADPAVVSRLKELYGAFKKQEVKKTATIDSWFTKYKTYKKYAKASDLNNIKSLLSKIKEAAESELAYCLQYVNDIETCIQSCPTLEYSSDIASIRSDVALLKNAVAPLSTEFEKPQLIPQSVITELDEIINNSNTLAANIKSGEVQYNTIEDAVTTSGIQAKVIKYRVSLLIKFCKLFTIEAAKNTVQAADYLGFTCCLTYIVFIMKLTGAKVKKVTGLTTSPQTVNTPEDSSDKKIPKSYKELLGSGWLAKTIYNELSAVIPHTDNSKINSV